MFKEVRENIIDFSYKKHFISLLYSCSLEIPCDTCAFSKIRNSIQQINIDVIEKFENEEIFHLFSEHKKCLIKRVKEISSKNILKITNRYQHIIVGLLWTNKCNIGILTTELKKRGWINSQSDFFKLFDNKGIDKKIFWNMQFKYELAFLLYKLKEGGFFRTINTRGYFKLVEDNVYSYSENKLPKGTLKFLNYKILKNPDKYLETIEEVSKIIKVITLCSK